MESGVVVVREDIFIKCEIELIKQSETISLKGFNNVPRMKDEVNVAKRFYTQNGKR